MRQSEPYTYCQFVMGRDHSAYGRARHPWLTGSAGWAYFAATHYILGIRPDYDGLVIDLYIIVSFGIKISEVVQEAQKKVKYMLEKSLSEPIADVNVFVQGVRVIG